MLTPLRQEESGGAEWAEANNREQEINSDLEENNELSLVGDHLNKASRRVNFTHLNMGLSVCGSPTESTNRVKTSD